MIPAYNKKRCAAVPFEMGIHFRRKTDFFPEKDTTKSYSGFEPEPEAYGATRGLLATDHVILNHGQLTWTTPELVPPLLTTTPHQREDVSALDRFNVHRCPTRGFAYLFLFSSPSKKHQNTLVYRVNGSIGEQIA
ncbi:uncharacterized protein TNCV_3901761 [Trichonephila clavipes]|nr:uncharacterized protein TNCV_3901761 [Trichonephila clavipes]